MELKGHKSAVGAVALSPDGTRAVTASKDGTLRVWNIDVRYAQQEDPRTLLVVSHRLTAVCAGCWGGACSAVAVLLVWQRKVGCEVVWCRKCAACCKHSTIYSIFDAVRVRE
jgi:WD40 repeat protein